MARGSSATALMILGALILITGLLAAPGIGLLNLQVTQFSSLNPHVGCSAVQTRISTITGNRTGFSSYSGSPFYPGTNGGVPSGAPSGSDAKRWLTATGPPPSGWISPGPPCTTSTGQGLYVEIEGLLHGSITQEDCSGSYNALNGGTAMPPGNWCDTTFNLYDPAVISNYGTSCSSATDPTCYARIHTEFDHDWKAAGYIGPSTSYANNSTFATYTGLVDIQGFVYWDGGQCTATSCSQPWHSFNGWEIHPITAWRPHVVAPPPQNLGAAFTYTPTTPVSGSPVQFSASVAGGTAPYFYNWAWGDNSVTNTTSASTGHTFSTAGSFTVTLIVKDSSSPKLSAIAAQTLTVTSPIPSLTATFSWSPTSPTLGQTVVFTSTVSGGIGPYTASWDFGDGLTAQGLSVSHSYAATGTFTVSLAVADSNSPPGTTSTAKTLLVQGPPPQQLTGSFTWSPSVPVTNNVVTFSASATGGVQPYSYSWSFGDGLTGTGQSITHTYGSAGTYTVTLTVTDSASGQTSSTNQVTIQLSTVGGGGGGIGIPLWAILSVTGLAMVLLPALFMRRR